ncbi:MAG: hypothetical protein R2724_17540 [Bryobacterales bacterium]
MRGGALFACADAGSATGLGAQYDRDMHPAWARIFEPPSVTGGESLKSAMRILLTLLPRETGDKRFLEPIPRASYLRSSRPPRS